jgi:hypothetical protein
LSQAKKCDINRGDLDQALEYFTEALSTAEASCGPDHPLVATITNTGITLRLKRQPEAARAEFERGVSIGQATLGLDHSDVARGLWETGGTAFFTPGVTQVFANATGTYRDTDFAVGPVPEPAGLGVLVLGALGLLTRRRHR